MQKIRLPWINRTKAEATIKNLDFMFDTLSGQYNNLILKNNETEADWRKVTATLNDERTALYELQSLDVTISASKSNRSFYLEFIPYCSDKLVHYRLQINKLLENKDANIFSLGDTVRLISWAASPKDWLDRVKDYYVKFGDAMADVLKAEQITQVIEKSRIEPSK